MKKSSVRSDGAMSGAARKMGNKHRGSLVSGWLAEEERRDPGFRAGVAVARARLDLAQKIYDARKKAGVSQPELARRLGTSQAAISRMEGGGQNMTIDTIESIAKALGGRFEGHIVIGKK